MTKLTKLCLLQWILFPTCTHLQHFCRTYCHVQCSVVVSLCSRYQNKYRGLVTEVSLYSESLILILLHPLSRIHRCVVLPTEALHPTSLTLTFFFSLFSHSVNFRYRCSGSRHHVSHVNMGCFALFSAAVLLRLAPPELWLTRQINCVDKQCRGHAGACLKLMTAALLIALKPITARGNRGWLLWGQLYPLARRLPEFFWGGALRCSFFFGWPEVWSAAITSSSWKAFYCSLGVFYFNFFLYQHSRFSWLLPDANLTCSKLLKAQLPVSGWGYGMNVLIIPCGHTVGVITSQSNWAGGKTVAGRLGSGWLNTEVLFTARIEMSCRWTGYFWTSDWLNPFSGPVP